MARPGVKLAGLSRSYGHSGAILVGTEVGLLVDKTPETMAGFRIVMSSMCGRGWRRNLHHKPAADTGSPFRLDKLRRLFGETTQDFNQRFPEEAP
jgi:hypothetical protein